MSRSTLGAQEIKAIYDRLATQYDRRERLLEWLLLRRHRRKLLSRARGEVLEVAIGTGLNLPFYPPECSISGTDLSPVMLQLAQRRAERLRRVVRLQEMDTQQLAFADESFDTVVSTLALCTVIDPLRALGEMARVTRPQGQLLLFEHGRCRYGTIARWQDRLTPHQVLRFGCHLNRNVLALVQAADLQIIWRESHLGGMLRLIQAIPFR